FPADAGGSHGVGRRLVVRVSPSSGSPSRMVGPSDPPNPVTESRSVDWVLTLEPGELWRLLPGRAGAARVEIGAGLGEPGEAEAGLLDDVEHRAIGAIDEAELGAAQPLC